MLVTFMKNILQISSLIILLSGCSSNEQPAEIERKDSLFYGRSGPHKVKEYKNPYTQHEKNDASDSEISEKQLSPSITHDAYQQEAPAPQQLNKNNNVQKNSSESNMKEQPVIKEESEEEEFDLSGIHKEEPKKTIKSDVVDSKDPLMKAVDSEGVQSLQAENTSGYRIEHPVGNPNFSWPIQGRVSSHWGEAEESLSEGITISVPIGTPVKASSAGEVTYVGLDEDYGNLIIIKHRDDIFTAYAYNSKVIVSEGSNIAKGQVIAHSGKTGNAGEPKLYFSIRKGSTTVDPEKLL